MHKLLSLLLCVGTALGVDRALPPVNVPGVADSRVTQANLGFTICVPGYSASVRPPESWSERMKINLLYSLHLPGLLSDYEYDHIIPIEAGGAAQNLYNLWMQPIAQARLKDRLENYVRGRICAKEMTLANGQAVFTGNFWAVYDKLAPVQHWPIWAPDVLPDDLVQEMRRQQGHKQ